MFATASSSSSSSSSSSAVAVAAGAAAAAATSGGSGASSAGIVATAGSTRTRRRARPASSDNSLHQPKAKRARIPLTETTFANPQTTNKQSQTEQPSQQLRIASGGKREGRQDGGENSAPQQQQQQQQQKKEMSFRSKKLQKAGGKGDGSVVLTTNTAFTISKLVAIPERLRADATARQHGTMDGSTGYGLSLTSTHAVVWPYAATTPSPESFVFTLPYPSKMASDPLPIGALISSYSSAGEPGLVVVMPVSGKITYWESISSATALDFMRQQRNGVEDCISGMRSGETVIQMVNAESAVGFVLAFSSGRMAYLSVRDSQGRPQISVQFLRTSLGTGGGGGGGGGGWTGGSWTGGSGIFGSIRNLVSHSAVQGDIAAVRSDAATRQGERITVAATAKGRLHTWRIHRGGHDDLLTEYDARAIVVDAIQDRDKAVIDQYPTESFTVLDFAFAPQDLESRYTNASELSYGATAAAAAATSDDVRHLVLLVSFTAAAAAAAADATSTTITTTKSPTPGSTRYYIVELLLPNGASLDTNQATVGIVRPIRSYTTSPRPQALAKPRIYLPKPAMLVFLVLGNSVVITSIARLPDSPDSQFMEDNHALPPPFEDVVDLRQDPTMEIVGSGFEEPHGPGPADDSRGYPNPRSRVKNPTALLLVRGLGTLRIAIKDVDRFTTDKPPVMTAKSKLEQAVYFGIRENNPLVFDVVRDLPFMTNPALGGAALELSYDILSSTNVHLLNLGPQLESNMQMRVRAMEKLMSHLGSLQVDLSRVTRWELLWNAEKLHAARTVWQKHEKFMQERPATSKKDIVAEVVEYIRTEEKSAPDVSRGEVDELRHWFTHDTYRMQIFMAWAYEVIKYNSMAQADTMTLFRFLYEAVELNNAAISDAFDFRKSHLPLYGLDHETLKDGILDNYTGMPAAPWTSDRYITNNLKRLVELATQMVSQNLVANSDGQQPPSPEQPLLLRIRSSLPSLTEIYLRSLQEMSSWALSSDDPQTVALGREFKETYDTDCHNKIVMLASSENWDDAIRIAETHRCLSALARVLIQETAVRRQTLQDPVGQNAETIHFTHDQIRLREAKVLECFQSYGEDFAYPFYEVALELSGIDAILDFKGDRQYKTQFLRDRPELARISWINDVVAEDDVEHAADTLLELSLARESRVWNKKIGLSLGKLARMADKGSRPTSRASSALSALPMAKNQRTSIAHPDDTDDTVARIDNELALIKIQDHLHSLIQPTIHAALDDAAALAMAMEAFPLLPYSSFASPSPNKILQEVYQDALRRLIHHEALDPLSLIDLLTLMRLPPPPPERDEEDPFYLALQVCRRGLAARSRERRATEKLVWRRCYLREDWESVNNTQHKGDDYVMDVLRAMGLCRVYAGLFIDEKHNVGTGTACTRLSPSQALGAYTETVDRRFTKFKPADQERLREVMVWEDDRLRKHVEKHRLELWVRHTQQIAVENTRYRLDAHTDSAQGKRA